MAPSRQEKRRRTWDHAAEHVGLQEPCHEGVEAHAVQHALLAARHLRVGALARELAPAQLEPVQLLCGSTREKEWAGVKRDASMDDRHTSYDGGIPISGRVGV